MTRNMRYVCLSEEDTLRAAKAIAQSLQPHSILCLRGDLGAGKTCFVRGVVEAWEGDMTQVHSPTFSLLHEYQTPRGAIIHCDFYRLADSNNLSDFGGLELFSEPALYCIEWPERIEALLSAVNCPVNTVKITITADGRILDFFP